MIPKSKWLLAETPGAGHVQELAKQFGLSPLAVRLAIQRGYDDEAKLARFLHPRLQDLADPFELPGMDVAVGRLVRAIEGSENIVLYGDYDVDGVSSTVLLTRVLNAYGLSPRVFLPQRLSEGYGLSLAGIKKAIAGNQPSLLIAADCGTNSRDETEWLRERNIDLVVLDHHEPAIEGVADCVAIVNPKLGKDYHYLCTAGVVFKVAHALLKKRPLENGFDLRDFLDLVALGTVADIVPLIDENRILVRRGLQQLDRTTNPGLQALKLVSGLRPPCDAIDVGFKIGPRLNAAGRVNTAHDAFDLLLSSDTGDCDRMAKKLDQLNRDRQDLEQKARVAAENQIESLSASEKEFALVVGGDDWHPGIVGIVASRLMRKYHLPTFIISFDDKGLGKGSGRSVEGISLVKALDHCRDLLEAGGGHDQAAGLSVARENLVDFRRQFNAYVGQQQNGNGDFLVPKVHIDIEAELDEIDLHLLDSYELLRPFGKGNPQPVLLSRGVQPRSAPRILKQKHVKFSLAQNGSHHEAIYFNAAGQELPRPPWDIAYSIDRNEYRGRVSISMIIQAIRSAEG
jgi:single-stranded-DNA-specific exonuclease